MSVIVVGVDGSTGSLKALRWAIDEARLRGGSVRAVAAWSLPVAEIMPAVMIPIPGGIQPGDAFADLLASIRIVCGDDSPPDVEPVMVEGDAATALIEESRDADLVVVGSRGHGGFAGLLLGSVSEHVARYSHCPVVVVPHRGT